MFNTFRPYGNVNKTFKRLKEAKEWAAQTEINLGRQNTSQHVFNLDQNFIYIFLEN